MTLEQLRIFVAVAEREHVTEGARALNLTPSAVSAAISTLEASYGLKFFDRVGRRIVLTESGRLFVHEAKAVLARAAQAEEVLTDLTDLKRGTLNLAASQTVANYWLPPLMCRFHEAAPGVKLALVIGNTETVAAMVHEGTVDLGFIEGEIDDPVLSITPVAEDELILVTAPNDGAKRRAPNSAELKAMRWVSRERGSATRELFEAALAEHGIRASDLDLAFELPSNEAVRAAVEAGAGAAVLSRQVVAASLKAGSLVVLRLALSKRRFYMLRHKERYASQAARKMLSLITPIDQAGNSRRPKAR